MEPVWMNRAVRGWTTLTAGKVLDLLAAALALQGLGDVIPFQAGCRPLELSGLILKHLPLKKGDSKYTGPGAGVWAGGREFIVLNK